MTLRRRAALALAALAALPSAPAVAQDAAAQLWRSAQIGVAVRAVWLDFACDAALIDPAALAALLDDAGADPATLAGPFWDIHSAALHTAGVIDGARRDGLAAYCAILEDDLRAFNPVLLADHQAADAPLDPRVRRILAALLIEGAHAR